MKAPVQRPKPRVTWDPKCPECALYKPTAMFPPHDASTYCESGNHNHCSCRRCF